MSLAFKVCIASFLFVLLSFAEGGEVRLCSTHVELVCRQPSPRPGDYIPGNHTEFRKLCSSTIDYVDCLHSYDLACTGRSRFSAFNPPLYYDRIKSFLTEACDETRPLNQVFGRSLECMKQRASIRGMVCVKNNRKVLAAYDKYLEKHAVRGVKEKAQRNQCLETVSTAACVMKSIESECGFMAYEAARDTILRTQILAEKCGLDVFLELQEVVDNLKIDSGLKQSIKKYFVVEISE